MKTAIVGCGRVADIHIPYILKSKNVQLVALCDENEIRVKNLAQRYSLPFYTSLSKMLEEIRPDVVHILTPPQTHATLAVQALLARCHVLVEKPLCLTYEEADAIYAAAWETGRQVSVDHTLLWSPLVQRARREVDSGRLGRLVHIQYVMGDDYLEAVKAGYARWALELRGGVICDLIPHALYLIRAFLPDAHVVSARACGTGIHNLCELWTNLSAKGAGASLWVSLNQRPLEHSLRLYCEGGTVYLDLRNYCLAVVPERGLPGPAARIINTLSESWQRGIGTLGSALGMILGRFDPRIGTAGAISGFYQAIAEGKPSPVRPEEARAVVELSTAVWDLLEGTPGAIQPALDECGRPIVHKATTDFTPHSVGEPPRILVTGGTGFIGSHLVRRLVTEGERVRVFCRESSSLDDLPTDGVEIAFGDVSDLDSVRRAMQGIKLFYHLAATMNGDWATHYQGSVVGTRNVLEAAVEEEVRKVVYVSSIGVLHTSRFPNGRLIDESFPLEQHPEARGYYSRAKLEAEKIAQEFARAGRLHICIVRPGLIYGPGRTEFLSDAGFRVSKLLTLVVGLGGRRLGLTYVENLVDALVLAAQSKSSYGKTYHIVDPDQPTVRQYIRVYRRVTGLRLRALYLPTFIWKAGFNMLDGLLKLIRGASPNLGYRLRSITRGPKYDNTVAWEELGWKTRVSFLEGMERSHVR